MPLTASFLKTRIYTKFLKYTVSRQTSVYFFFTFLDVGGGGNLPFMATLAVFTDSPGFHKVSIMDVSPKLSRKAIESFVAIYEEEFGQKLSNEAAQEVALGLLRLFKTLLSTTAS